MIEWIGTHDIHGMHGVSLPLLISLPMTSGKRTREPRASSERRAAHLPRRGFSRSIAADIGR